MLPVYEAIDIIKVIPETVGHTRPWVVLANTPNGLKSFVTKLYTPSEIESNNSVTNEIICNVLSSQFDLKAPSCALIDIPETLQFKKSIEWQRIRSTNPVITYLAKQRNFAVAVGLSHLFYGH